MTMAAAHPWVRFLAALLFCGGLYLGFVSAQEPDKQKSPPPDKLLELPKALSKPAPENVEDLRDIETHVQAVLKKVMPAVVGVRVGFGQGSGVIVNEDGTILTAGHVSGNPNQNAAVILPNGKSLKAKTLGRHGGYDSGMMKISEEGKYPFLEMGKSSELKPGQWVIGIGHPGGFRPNRTPVVRVGRILFANAFVIRTDCTLVGGDSGGPLFDMQGRVIGIHSRIGGLAITENLHVPVDAYRKDWDRLARGDNIPGNIGQMETVRSAGGKVVFSKKDSLTKDDPTLPSPMDKDQKSYCKTYTFRLKTGHTYTFDLLSGDKTGKRLDTYLKLETPEGKLLAEDDDGGGFPHSRIVYKALKEGDYRIIATSFEPNQTGPFTLKILDADFTDAVVSGKVDVLKAIKVPPPAVVMLVEKFGQAKVPLHVNAVVIDDKGEPMPNKEITVLWDKGKETLKSNKEGVVRWPLLKDKSKKMALELPAGARAMLALTDPNGTSIGLKFNKHDPSIETVKSAGGNIVKTFDGVITKTDPFDLEREKCYRHIHEFKMVTGKTYTLDLVSEDFDSYLRIENDEKGKLAEDDDGGGFLNSRIVFTPKDAGTYRLVVTTCDPGQHGAYRLTIRETNAEPAEPKKDEKKADQ
jgi:serine protease Do